MSLLDIYTYMHLLFLFAVYLRFHNSTMTLKTTTIYFFFWKTNNYRYLVSQQSWITYSVWWHHCTHWSVLYCDDITVHIDQYCIVMTSLYTLISIVLWWHHCGYSDVITILYWSMCTVMSSQYNTDQCVQWCHHNTILINEWNKKTKNERYI
jgi:hypothetical protein